MSAWIITLNQTAPLYVWIASAAATVVLMVVIIRAVRRQRAAEPSAERMSRLQLIGALAFSSVVIAAFMIGTFEGGVAFAHDMLGWNDWRRVIPWGSFDAASIGFSLFAIRAIGRGRSPRAAMRVVYLSAASSACVQLMEGGGLHKWQGGLFLAALAATSAMVLHNIMDQLSGRATIKQVDDEKLRFGKRWFTSMPSTLCAWLAWTNYPAEDLAPTVANSLRHLDSVREAKRAKMTSRPAWRFLAPLLYASRLAATAEALRVETAETIRESNERVAALTARVEAAEALTIEREAKARVDTEATLRDEYESTITELRDQLRETLTTSYRPSPRPRVDKPIQRKSPQVVDTIASDEAIADKLFDSYRELAEANDSPPTEYWVRKNGSCWPRQAGRVLEMLASRYAESSRETSTRSGRETFDSADDLERELAVTG